MRKFIKSILLGKILIIIDSIYVVIPAYNEEENIEWVIKDWYSIFAKFGRVGRSVRPNLAFGATTYMIAFEGGFCLI